MWFIIFFGFCNIICKSSSQELASTNFQTSSEDTRVSPGSEWNKAGSLFREVSRPRDQHGPQNEITDYHVMYPGQWKPLNVPVNFNPYGYSHPSESSNEKLKDYDIQQYISQPPSDESVQTMPHPNVYSESDHILRTYEDLIPYPQTSRSHPQNQFSSVSTQPKSSMTYPATVNVNIRSYTKNAQDTSNSTVSSSGETASDPKYSTLEHKYTRVLPSYSFLTMPFTGNQVSPFGRYNIPFYYPAASPYFTPYNVITSTAMNPLTSEGRDPNFSTIIRESGVSNPPVTHEKELPLHVDVNPVTYAVPRKVPAAFYPSLNLNAPIDQFPFLFPRPTISSIFPRPVVPRFLPPVPTQVSEETSIPLDFIAPEVLPQPLDPSLLPVENYEQPEIIAPETLQHVADNIQTEKQADAVKLPYEFGYDMNDGKGTDQHRIESLDSAGVVRGSYGYRDLFGVYRLVNYVADENGFRAFVKSNEPGVATSESAGVVFRAEQPPPHALEESLKLPESEPSIKSLSYESADLIAESSESEITS